MNWRETWLDNYNGKSEASKSLENFMKKNYKGHHYVPWATMVRWLYLQDPEATLEVVKTEDGDYVHTSKNNIETNKLKSDTKKLEEIREDIYNVFLANFVVVKCTFLGRTFEEVYPIQDNAYAAPNYYDSNMVNKSIQRAKAKLISTATGIAFKLYEDGDLQFEDDDVKTNTQKTVKVDSVVAPVKDVKKDILDVLKEDKKTNESLDSDVINIVDLILDNKDDILPILKMINVEIVKSYNFQLSTEDSKDELISKVSQIKNVKIFHNMLKRRLEDKKGSK
jgi:hypothetical protein